MNNYEIWYVTQPTPMHIVRANEITHVGNIVSFLKENLECVAVVNLQEGMMVRLSAR